MIGKIVKVKNINKIVDYILSKQDTSWVLCSNLVERSISGIVEEFKLSERVSRGRDIFRHIVLSIPPNVRLQEWQWTELVHKYLKAMGFGDGNQMIAVRHSDRPHQHCHIVISRLDLERDLLVSDGLDYYRSQEVVKQLSEEYKLGRAYAAVEIFKRLIAQHNQKDVESYDNIIELDGIVFEQEELAIPPLSL